MTVSLRILTHLLFTVALQTTQVDKASINNQPYRLEPNQRKSSYTI
jgi:hypothetical protein